MAVDPATIIERFLARPRVALIRAVLDTYGRAPGGLLANGLAFAALFTVVPIALVTLGVAGWLVDDPRIQDQLAAAIGSIVPPLAGLVDGALDALSEGAALSSFIGIIGVVWTVSQFYSTLDVAFSRIFTERPERDLLRRTARGFVWVGGLIAVIIALVVAGSLAAAAEALLPASSTALTAFGRVVSSLPVVVALGVLVVAVLYRVLPPRAPSWRAAWLPAIVAGVTIVFLSQAFLFLAPRIVGAAAFAGSLATAFVALAWLSLTFQVLLLGAAWVRVRDHRPISDESGLAAPAAPAEPSVGRE
ncbi:MAG: YihY/virulence factor BrkB family protein [Candidatus Limnocylindrales bacterium]